MNKIQYMWFDRKYLTTRRLEKIMRWIVWRLPRKFIMWCYIRVASNATAGKYKNTNVTELRMMTALKRWDEDNNEKS